MLYTPVIADVLDKLGYREQTFRPEIRPLFPATGGRRRANGSHDRSPRARPPEPYKGEMAAVDALGPGDVMVVSQCDWSFWGELLSTAARYRGCRGVVIDGYTRDTRAIIAMGFPVFCRGIHPADSLGRLDVAAYDVPIHCGGVLVGPGDLILADDDGVVAIPRPSPSRRSRWPKRKSAAKTWFARRLPRGCRSRRHSGVTAFSDTGREPRLKRYEERRKAGIARKGKSVPF